MPIAITRRNLGAALGAAAGAALLDTKIARAAARVHAAVPDGVVRLNANENPYGPCAKALEAFGRSDRAANRYPDALDRETQNAIARHHGVGPERIVLGCGSSEILQMADTAFLGPGKNAVAAEPTFEAVLMYAGVVRAESVKVPLTSDYRHDLPGMAQACTEKTGLVYICNPNNPTGTIVTGDELAAFAARVPRSTTILVDEAYHHFVEDPRYRSACELIEKNPNVVVARTFSKIYGMAGLRLGYAVGSEERIARLSRYASWSNANGPVLSAALASLADADLVPRMRKTFSETRRWLQAEMARMGRRVIPSETNFVMIDVGADVAPVIQAFRERKVLVGRKFPSLPNWLRVTIGKREEMEAFVAAFARVVPSRTAA